MPKINQEEYEILKALDDRWNWIARDKFAGQFPDIYQTEPLKGNEMWFARHAGDYETIENGKLFQFVKWEDVEPYNIAELIEEYEENEAHDIINRQQESLYGDLEGEEKEVKDIEWLENEVRHEYNRNQTRFVDTGNERYADRTFAFSYVLQLIKQLDVPEFPIYDAHDKIREESTLTDKSFDYYWNCIADGVEIDEPGNLLVPRQEEVDPDEERFNRKVNKIIKAIENPKRLKLRDVVEKMESLSEVNQKQWLDRLNKKFGEIESEPKYYVEDNHSLLLIKVKDKIERYDKNTNYDYIDKTLALTEQEIKDYDPRYWAFAEPVEELKE